MKPLADRIHAALVKHGEMTSDAIAQCISVKANKVSASCVRLKAAKRITSRAYQGETFWKAK